MLRTRPQSALRLALSSAVILSSFSCGGEAGPTTPETPQGPTPESSLSFLIGTWSVRVVHFDATGDSLVLEGYSSVTRELSDGALSEVLTSVVGDSLHRSETLMIPIPLGSWLLAKGDGGAGTFDVLEGRLFAGAGTMTSRAGTRPDGGVTRLRFEGAYADSVTIAVEHSDDGGTSWALEERYEYTRSSAGPPALDDAKICEMTEHHHFDFWLGDWDAVGVSGQGGGRNDIRSRLGGCILEENWIGGAEGRSFNMFDRRTGLWYQVWVDTSGLRLVLQGGLDPGDRMVLEGETVVSGQKQRITWEARPDGTVRQTGEAESSQGGWAGLYDLVYTLR